MNHLARLLVHIKQLSKIVHWFLCSKYDLMKLAKIFDTQGAQFQAFKHRAQGVVSSEVSAAVSQGNVKPKIPPQQGACLQNFLAKFIVIVLAHHLIGVR